MSASDKSPWPPWGGPPRTAVLTTTGMEQQELLLHWGKSNGRCRSQRALPRLRTGLAQSSMASSWSAKASNMVLMSSRMCLVEVLGGLQWRKDWVRSARSQITTLALSKGAVTECPVGVKHIRESSFSQPPQSVGVASLHKCTGAQQEVTRLSTCASKWQPPDSLCRSDLDD